MTPGALSKFQQGIRIPPEILATFDAIKLTPEKQSIETVVPPNNPSFWGYLFTSNCRGCWMTGMVGCFRCIGFVQLKRFGRLDRHVSGGQKKCTTLGLYLYPIYVCI